VRPRRGRGGRPDAPRPHGGGPTTAAVGLGGARRPRRGTGAGCAHGRGVVPPRRGRSRRGSARGRPPPPERWGVEPNGARRPAAAPPSPSPSPRAAVGGGPATADAGGAGATAAPRLLRAGRPADVTVSPPRRPRRQPPVARLAAATPMPGLPAPRPFSVAPPPLATAGGHDHRWGVGATPSLPCTPTTTRRTATAQGRGGGDWLPSRMHRRDGNRSSALPRVGGGLPPGGGGGVGGGGGGGGGGWIQGGGGDPIRKWRPCAGVTHGPGGFGVGRQRWSGSGTTAALFGLSGRPPSSPLNSDDGCGWRQ